MYQQFFQNIRPPTLLDASLYNLIQNKSWVINNIGQVWNHLPPSVKKLFLDEAFKHLDNTRDISLLLKIFLMSVQSGEPQCLRSIKTPKYIESSDTETRQDLLKILLETSKSSNRHKTKILDFQMFKFIQDIYLFMPDEENLLLSEVIEAYMSNLEVLVLPVAANLKILQIIAEKGDNLKVLDISHSSEVTSEDVIATLCRPGSKCVGLQRLSIEGTAIKEKGVSALLKCLPSLQVIESSHLVRAFANLRRSRNESAEATLPELSLTKVAVDSQLSNTDSAEVVRSISELCPKLAQLTISYCSNLQVTSLAQFCSVGFLQSRINLKRYSY